MPPPYSHTPFQGSYSIRVLFLHPELNCNAPLHCSLTELPLDPAPEYTALSYAWDAQSPSCPVQCDGGMLSVTPNCESALRQLRHGQDVQKLWIDSICIDQTSPQERSQQVALMGEIYKRAQQVVVWLGEGDSRTDLAMQRLLEIGQVGSEEDKARKASTMSLVFGTGVRNPSGDPLGPVFERSWFYRVWTVQEVTLPLVENVVVRCGSIAFPWIFLLIAVSYLKTAKYRWGRWDEATHLQKRISGFLMDKRQVGSCGIFDDNPKGKDPYQTSLQVLASTRAKQATKPEDKIFALFGMMKELDVDFPLPDYEKPLEQVYTEAAVACINHDRSLHILFEVPSDNRRSGLPSWVPDWSDVGWRPSDPRKAELEKGFRAAGLANPQWSFSADQRRLLLSGRLVDSIRHRGAALELDGDFDLSFLLVASDKLKLRDLLRRIHPAFGVLRSWVGISSQYKDYPTGETTEIALRDTLVGGDVTQASHQSIESAFDAWHEILIGSDANGMATLVRKIRASPPHSPEEPEVSDSNKRAQLEQFPVEWQSFLALATGPASGYHFEVLRRARKKCFFATANGYFGTAASLVEEGDKIAVLAGLETPMVLRRVDQGYHFVTHAYVHGIMYGDAWPSGAETSEIVLV